jgi:plasmid stabilization system protein ParE
MDSKKKTTATDRRQVRISVAALQNIHEVTGYIAFIKQAPLTAIKVGDAIFATINRIEKNPTTFHECEEIRTKTKMYRRAVCFSWLIIYKITPTEIIILGIIHGARKPSKIRNLRKVK